MLSILAGFMIGVGGTVYLTVGGPVGAFLFATGLFTIITFKLELFTGKAGLLATREISGRKLTEIWCGNFIGTMLAALGGSVGPNHVLLESKAAAIVQAKLANGTIENFIAAIFCGLLMYVAVSGFAKN